MMVSGSAVQMNGFGLALGLEVDEGTEHAALQAAGEFAEEAGEGSAYEPEVPLLTAAGGSD